MEIAKNSGEVEYSEIEMQLEERWMLQGNGVTLWILGVK